MVKIRGKEKRVLWARQQKGRKSFKVTKHVEGKTSVICQKTWIQILMSAHASMLPFSQLRSRDEHLHSSRGCCEDQMTVIVIKKYFQP